MKPQKNNETLCKTCSMDYTDIVIQAFDATLEGLLLTDHQSNIVFINKAVKKHLGYTPKEIIGENLDSLLPGYNDEVIRSFTNPKNNNPNTYNIIGIHKNGKEIQLKSRFSYFKHQNNKFAIIYLSGHNHGKIIEKKEQHLKLKFEEKVKTKNLELSKVFQELQQTNKILEKEIHKNKEAQKRVRKALEAERELSQLKTKFISMASHEFRTPLSGILTSATLIEKYNKDINQKTKKHVFIIKKLVNQLNKVLNDFMSLEKIEKGKNNIKPSYFELDQLIQNIISEANSYTKKGQKIKYSSCIECPTIYQDNNLIYTTLTNVLFNAIKYSGENTTISIEVNYTDFIEIRIKDQGIGIPKEDQRYIFSRFFRASNSTHIQGTGIGLNIVKANVKAMGGNITFNSEQNQGTEFIINIPTHVIIQPKN